MYLREGDMGRVYDVRADKARGEIPARHVRLYAWTQAGWQHLPGVTRVEFDADADAGRATVTMLVRAGDQFALSEDGGERVAARATFRCVARILPVPSIPTTTFDAADDDAAPLVVEAVTP